MAGKAPAGQERLHVAREAYLRLRRAGFARGDDCAEGCDEGNRQEVKL
jgi:hypothetical protein